MMKYAACRLSSNIAEQEYHCEWVRMYSKSGRWMIWGGEKPLFIFGKEQARRIAQAQGCAMISEDGDCLPDTFQHGLKMYVSGWTLLKMQGLSTPPKTEVLDNTWALVLYTKTKSDYWFDGIVVERQNLQALIDRYGDHPIANKAIERSPITTVTSVFV